VNYTTLITAEQLQALMGSGAPLMVFDCSFELMKPLAGDQQFAEAHIPGAVRADLDRHLSAQSGAPAASGGRHPAAQSGSLRTLAGRHRVLQHHAGRGVRPPGRQLLWPPVVDAQVGGP
jgi:thiosulfate/3-mercaptopyruvate sulfurtransferase